jgi:hypothetical protein
LKNALLDESRVLNSKCPKHYAKKVDKNKKRIASFESGVNIFERTLCLKIMSLVLGKEMRTQLTGQEMHIA